MMITDSTVLIANFLSRVGVFVDDVGHRDVDVLRLGRSWFRKELRYFHKVDQNEVLVNDESMGLCLSISTTGENSILRY